MGTTLLFIQKRQYERAISVAFEVLKDGGLVSRRCTKLHCKYCRRLRLGMVMLQRTREVMDQMFKDIEHQPYSKMIFSKHLREEYGNYNGYILTDGRYIDVWRLGGHRNFKEQSFDNSSCSEGGEQGSIKIHAKRRSEIQLCINRKVPTVDQLQTLSDLILDSDKELWFSFPIDIFHPDLSLPF